MHEPESPLELALCGSSSPSGHSESVASPESLDSMNASWIEASCKEMREANDRTLKEVDQMRTKFDQMRARVAQLERNTASLLITVPGSLLPPPDEEAAAEEEELTGQRSCLAAEDSTVKAALWASSLTSLFWASLVMLGFFVGLFK